MSASQHGTAPTSTTTPGIISTLAGPYVIRCLVESEHSYAWSLYPLAGNEHTHVHPSVAWQALHRNQHDTSKQAEACIQVDVDQQLEMIKVKWTQEAETSKNTMELNSILEAVAVQWAASQQSWLSTRQWQVVLSSGDRTCFHMDDKPINLFANTLEKLVNPEWVEMVDQSGRPLGMLPRPLVHTHNLLHRGIGLFVTKDSSIFESSEKRLPELYVHQRTATKRIFPSLYDMFVGGVATAGESSHVTAQREVAEELGLNKSTHLSNQPVLTCVVCTGYNRCVVDLYEYVMNTAVEKVAWQAEEVAWGSFCSYALIEAAADRSIQRLEAQQTWPGSTPIIQSPRKGELSEQVEDLAWEEWDFVPDGLLVWEAWLRWRTEQGSSLAQKS